MVSTQPLTNAVQHRPGGRTADITRRIHDAVLGSDLAGGHGACTFQNVASQGRRRALDALPPLPQPLGDDESTPSPPPTHDDARMSRRREVFAAISPVICRGSRTRSARRWAWPCSRPAPSPGSTPASREVPPAVSGNFAWNSRTARPGGDRSRRAAGRRRPDALFATADGPLYFRLADRRPADRRSAGSSDRRPGLQGVLPYGPLSTVFLRRKRLLNRLCFILASLKRFETLE